MNDPECRSNEERVKGGYKPYPYNIKTEQEGNRKWMLNRNVAVNQRNTYSQIQEECNLSKSNRAWKGGKQD